MIIVALDPPLGKDRSLTPEEIVYKTKENVAGYKVGLPLILECGLGVIDMIKKASNLEVIVDFKLADIGDIMLSTAKKIFEAGGDTIIAHGFVGVDEALDKLVEESKREGKQVILVVSMSHKGSTKYIDKHLEEMLEDALTLGVKGVVLPATRPHLIRKARSIVGRKLLIYSPGIGAQGAEPGSAICAGADYEIIGRAITRATDPLEALKSIIDRQRSRVSSCAGYQ